MEMVLFRTALAPMITLLASLAARRLGPRWGGRLLGAPLTTGPFLMLLCVELGPAAAARAAQGAITGQLAVAGFCLTYGRIAARLRPVCALPVALGVGAGAGLLGVIANRAWLSAAVALAVILAGLLTWPDRSSAPVTERRAARWELPARMAVSGVIVGTLVTTAPLLGPAVAGTLSALPVLLAVLTPSVHHSLGAAAAADVARGALVSAAGTVAFLLVLSAGLVPAGPVVAFALAVGGLLLGGRLILLPGKRIRSRRVPSGPVQDEPVQDRWCTSCRP
jgi:hypothetical protein